MEQLICPVTNNEADKSGRTDSSEDNTNALFPSQLRELRKEKGISQEILARDLGVSKSTIGLYETGDTLPDAQTLHDLAVYFGVSADWLLGLSRARAADANVRRVCDLTGLSEASLNRLVSAAKRKKTTWAAVINQFLLQPRILDALHAYLFFKVNSFAVVGDSKVSDDRLGMIALVDDEAGRCAIMTPDMMDGAMQIEIQKELSEVKQQIKARSDNGAAKE